MKFKQEIKNILLIFWDDVRNATRGVWGSDQISFWVLLSAQITLANNFKKPPTFKMLIYIMSPSPRTTKNKDRPLWTKSLHTSHYVLECSSGKEHSMRASGKAFLLSLIQNEDSLTSILTAIPALVRVGKTGSMPPTTASYLLWSRCVCAKAKSAETSGTSAGPVPLPEGAHPTTQPPDTGREMRGPQPEVICFSLLLLALVVQLPIACCPHTAL